MENPEDNPEIMAGPMLLLLRRMEKMELLLEGLQRRGIVTAEDIELANLKSTLNHAERVIRVRENTKRDKSDVEQARDTVQAEVTALERRLGYAV